MIVKTEEERMQHPRAKLIPFSLWNDPVLFNDVLALGGKGTPSFSIFYCAAEHGQLEVLKYLEHKMPNFLDAMIEAQDFHAFRYAARYGHLEVLKYLVSKISPQKISAMIEAKKYAAFRYAAQYGFIEVLEFLATVAPEHFDAMIRAEEHFDAYRSAASEGHLEVVKWLELKAPQAVQAMIKAANFYAFRKSVLNHHVKLSHHILSQSSACFAFAEESPNEYQGITTPYVIGFMDILHATSLSIPADAVFDILNPEQAKICFYIIRRFIRLNNRDLDGELSFLLNIPSVKALAHCEVTSGRPNELLQLALSLGNSEAATILLNIPEVREMTQAHNDYHSEQQGRLAAPVKVSESGFYAQKNQSKEEQKNNPSNTPNIK